MRTVYESTDGTQARSFAERLTDRGYVVDLARDPSNPVRTRVIASLSDDKEIPDVSDLLDSFPGVREA